MDRDAFPLPTAAARTGGLLASVWTIPAAMLLVFGGALAWVGYDDYQETLQREYRYLDAHTRIAQDRIAELVHGVRQALTHVAAESAAYPAQRHAAYGVRLAEYVRDLPAIRTISVMDADGRVVATSDPAIRGSDGSQHESFAALRAESPRPEFHVSRPHQTVQGDYSISFSLPILDDRQRMLGIVEADAQYSALKDAMQEIRPTQSRSTAAILHDSGDFVFHTPYADGGTGRSASANQAFQAFLASGRNTTQATAAAMTDGLSRMYVIRPIDDTPLSVAVTLPLDDVLAPWRRRMLLRSLVFVVAATLILRLTGTARRRQREIVAGQEFSDRLIATANAMMLVLDDNGRIMVANEAAERITGFPREELVGCSVFETLMPRSRFPQAWQAFVRYREAGEVPRAIEAPIQTRNGEKRVIAWQNSAIFADGDAPAVLSFGIDVTERVQLQQLRNREEISRRLVGIQEDERRRLAVELHDRTSPNLTILDINLKLLADALPKDSPPELANLLEDTSATLADTIASIRSVSFDFRPPLLDYAGLWPTLNAYARQFSRRTGIAVHLAEPDPTLKVAPEVETNLFRIAQEALTNCARHSHAATVSIALYDRGDAIVLTIDDDGAGFETDRAQGTGLVMMRQRAAFIGGRLELETRPGQGTRLSASFSAAAAAGSGNVPCSAHLPASHASAPAPAARPLAKHAVSR